MARQTSRKQEKTTKSTKPPAREGLGDFGAELTAAPVALAKRFGEEMERLFGEFGLDRNWVKSVARGDFGQAGLWAPQIEMFERDGELVVRADLPGLTRDDVNVELNDGGITIEGERRTEKEDKREGYYHSERRYGKFYRRLPLPEGVNVEDATATFNNGVLEITMEAPKPKQAKTRRLTIRDDSQPKAKQQAA
jgi:HSP20 family protein